MMSITLRQPLASLLVMGPKIKPSLLRVGSTRYTGQVLVIAAYDWDEETEADCEFAARELIRRGLPALPLSPPLSFAVGLARVVECHEKGEPLHELDALFER